MTQWAAGHPDDFVPAKDRESAKYLSCEMGGNILRRDTPSDPWVIDWDTENELGREIEEATMPTNYETFIVTGGREFARAWIVREVLDFVTGPRPATLLVGDCPTGVDAYARDWAQEAQANGNPVTVRVFAADWAGRARSAGPIRNQKMVDAGADMCVVFLAEKGDNRGTRDTARRAEKAGMTIMRVWEAAYAQRMPSGVFECPKCGMKSYSEKDLEHGYCGNCHEFTAAFYRS